ncbi:hypothetical protein [Hymenobacter sp. YC55]|uniref:hypothetical protein n=1 Tax=Hymenobacter sp. YC55 TaxID=3034019 RepID=UPI0023F9B1E0|nr:hypothetical protein [Hymenobacter sp. YC55]MDF7809941.1 hypothetical protein [Hymenobacter sp. YC55]
MKSPLRALSLVQPYATLITLGYKYNETRSFSTKHRGPLLIHASAGSPRWAREVSEQDPIIRGILEKHGLTFKTLPRGVIICSCELLEVSRIIVDSPLPQANELHPAQLSDTERACGNYEPGRFAWHLAHVQVLPEPLPAKGSLGLWNPANQIPGL